MINLKEIGYIRTPYKNNAPDQPIENDDGQFLLEIEEEYLPALSKLEEFKYIYVLFYLDRTDKGNFELTITKEGNKRVGLFATRTPDRPNPIGLSIVKVIRIDNNHIYISGIDAYDNTPILDIKPYIDGLDNKTDANSGWISEKDIVAKGKQDQNIYLYTDGACSGNPGPGGYAALIKKGEEEFIVSGYEPETTNNRMELIAVIEGLKEIEKNSYVKLVSDSNYVIKGLTEWIDGWKRNGWKTAGKKPVKNKDLWMELDKLVQHYRLDLIKVKGHSGHIFNERVDSLAREQIEKNI